DFALFESGFDELALAMAANEEVLGEGIYGFGADSVETDTELEDVVVVFGAGVNLRDAIHDFAEGDAASEIADGDGLFLDGDMDLFASAHDEFINAIVDDFLKQNVTAIIAV